MGAVTQILSSWIILLLITHTEAGDDASVHVHVESAPGPDMGMQLPLFNYYRNAVGAPANPALAAQFMKWHGDEVHSQGADPVVQPTAAANSAEAPVEKPRSPRSGRFPRLQDATVENDLGHGSTRPGGPSSRHKHDDTNYNEDSPTPTYDARQRPGTFKISRPGWTGTYKFSRKSSHSGEVTPSPRHQHSETAEVIPAWLLRKRSMRKYGVPKYLSPYARIGIPDAPEETLYFDRDAQPIRVSARATEGYPETRGRLRRAEFDYEHEPDYRGSDY